MANVTVKRIGNGVINPVGNPVWLILQSDGGDPIPSPTPNGARPLADQYYSTGVVFLYTDGGAFAGFDAGDTITIDGITLTCGTDFLSGITEPNNAILAGSVADAVNSNPTLSTYLYAVPEGPTVGGQWRILISATVAGSAYLTSLVVDSAIVRQSLPAFTGPFLGVDPSRAAQLDTFAYKVYADILLEGQQVSSISAPVSVLNEAALDLSDYLRPFLSVALPPVAQFAVQEQDQAVRTFEVQYGEQFTGGFDDATELPIDPTDSIARRYLVGSISVNAGVGAVRLDDATNDYLDRVDGITVLPMTSAPDYTMIPRDTRFNSPISTYIRPSEGGVSGFADLRWDVTYTFYDGTTETASISLGRIFNEKVVTLDAGYAALGCEIIRASTGKDVLLIQADLVATRRSGTETTQFTILRQVDQNYEPTQYQAVCWLNTFGVYEVAVFEGVRSDSISAERSDYRQSLSTSDQPQLDRRIRATYQAQGEHTITLRSGVRDIADLLHYEEIVRSPEVYILTEYRGTDRWQAIQVTGNELAYDSNDELFTLNMAAVYATPLNSVRS